MARSNPHDVCDLCGNPLPTRPKGKRGAPQQYCDLEETGRPCVEFSKRFGQCRRWSATILARSPSATRDRARFRIRREYRTVLGELKQEPE